MKKYETESEGWEFKAMTIVVTLLVLMGVFFLGVICGANHLQL